MSIISVGNQKGGTGKTSTVFAMGEILAGAYGKSVIMVDLDPQASLSLLSGVKVDKTITDVFEGYDIRDAVVELRENLFILPSDIRLADVEIKSPRTLSKLLEPATVDYILVDLPPSLNELTANGLVASDWVVIPARPTLLDVAGLGLFLDIVKQAQALNKALKVAGVLLTFVDTRSISMGKVIKTISLPILGSVGVSVKVAEAVGKSIVRYSPSNPRSREYIDFVANLLEAIK